MRLSMTTLATILVLHGSTRADQPETTTSAPSLPTLFIIGDSTVKNGSGKGADGLWGWGDPIAAAFDKSKIRVENRARGGRSSRTYQTEGLWDQLLTEMKPGDFVLIQFGHNDGGPLNTGRARASLKGIGDETQEVVMEATGKKEVVHTYGWYIRKYITDAKARGATPIVLSPVPRNMWRDDRVVRASNDYGKWAEEAAKAEGAAFIDLNDMIARRYEAAGPETVKSYFPGDHTHTNAAGAELNAAVVVEGIKGLKDGTLSRYLSTAPKD
jgi:lysophospholipase L1-like esterase